MCEQRDIKGLYRLARENRIKEFTGISAPYEAPAAPDLILDTKLLSLDECVEKVIFVESSKSNQEPTINTPHMLTP